MIKERKAANGILKAEDSVERNEVIYNPKMERFMIVVEKDERDENCWVDRKSEWTAAKVSRLWTAIGRKYVYYGKFANHDGSRRMTLAWKTMLNKMVKRGTFKRLKESSA